MVPTADSNESSYVTDAFPVFVRVNVCVRAACALAEGELARLDQRRGQNRIVDVQHSGALPGRVSRSPVGGLPDQTAGSALF